MKLTKRTVVETAFVGIIGGYLVANFFFGPLLFVVVSGSMVPALNVNDVIFVEHTSISNVRVDDIVVFQAPSRTGVGCSQEDVVHRVVGFGPNGTLATKGDANSYQDQPILWPYVPASCFIGKVLFTIPEVGYVSKLLPFPSDILLVILIILVFAVSEYAVRQPRTELEPQSEPAL